MELLAQHHEALEAQLQERTARLRQEVAQRPRAEAALRQSQRWKLWASSPAVSRTTSNNILTGVIGSLDIMRRRIAAHRLEGPRPVHGRSSSVCWLEIPSFRSCIILRFSA
jgi:hypothetical protein